MVSSIKKTIIFLVGIGLVVFGYVAIKLVIKVQQKITQTNKYIAKSDNDLSYAVLQELAIVSRDKVRDEVIKVSLENSNLNEVDKNNFRKQLCNSAIENSGNVKELAESYICLAKISESNNEIFSSIKNASYAVAVSPSEENKRYLAKLIIGESSISVEDLIRNERETLELLAKSSDKNQATRAMYRLHLLSIPGFSDESSSDIQKSFELQNNIIKLLSIEQTKQTNVAFVFNEKYSKYAITTILSILLNSDLDNHYNFYAVYDPEDPITLETQQKITSLSKLRKFNIEFIAYPKELLHENKDLFNLGSARYYPRIVLFKTSLEKVLTQLDKVLVLDVDIIVRRDLFNLGNMELGNSLMAASVSPRNIEEGISRRGSECEGLPKYYINSGVLVENLKLMREENISSLFLGSSCKYKCNYVFPEQDLINQTISHRLIYLSSRWNMIPQIRETSIEQLYPNGFDPFIIHYAGIKPWESYYLDKIKASERISKYVMLYYPYMEYAQKLFQ